ncbi:MAG: flagellar biosynthesis protein FlhF [Lachnospirales bacterium]
MKVKNFEGNDEQEVLTQVKNEMGPDAVILNIKKITQKGLFAFLRKNKVIVTAAIDEKEKKREIPSKVYMQETKQKEKTEIKNVADKEDIQGKKNTVINKNSAALNELNEKLAEITSMDKDSIIRKQNKEIEKLKSKLAESNVLINKLGDDLKDTGSKSGKYTNQILNIIYDTLIENEICEEVAEFLIDGVDEELSETNLIVTYVYSKIVELISNGDFSGPFSKVFNSNTLVFLGPTGVGKTTTIAKLTSKLVLEESANVGLITADTYRIAAVEQLQTYVDILNLDMEVVYNHEDMKVAYKKLKNKKDIIIVDTAGRSHKNTAQVNELKELVEVIPESENFLVLSLTTKSEDLNKIIEVYTGLFDYSLIFTKADETTRYGNLVNTCFITGKKIAFITNGQLVPDDIAVLNADFIARSVMGLEGDGR